MIEPLDDQPLDDPAAGWSAAGWSVAGWNRTSPLLTSLLYWSWALGDWVDIYYQGDSIKYIAIPSFFCWKTRGTSFSLILPLFVHIIACLHVHKYLHSKVKVFTISSCCNTRKINIRSILALVIIILYQNYQIAFLVFSKMVKVTLSIEGLQVRLKNDLNMSFWFVMCIFNIRHRLCPWPNYKCYYCLGLNPTGYID